MDGLNEDSILEELEDELNSLGEVDSETIESQKREIIGSLGLPDGLTSSLLFKLRNYKYMVTPDELTEGRYIRWIRIDDLAKTKLTAGGIIVSISDEGETIVCKNSRNMLYQVRFDRSLIFQKLTEGEELIRLMTDFAKS